jgi:DNA mismatch endonuclease (patch repair protein)
LDFVTKETRSWMMSRVARKDTLPEKIIHQELKKKKIKFSRHIKSLPGSPDIVFPDKRIAIFIDGDFWHGWRFPRWKHKLKKFWKNKIETNRKRDQRNFRKLRRMNWKVIRIWEHQIQNDSVKSVLLILKAVRWKSPPYT